MLRSSRRACASRPTIMWWLRSSIGTLPRAGAPKWRSAPPTARSHTPNLPPTLIVVPGLVRLGLTRGERVLMVVKDCPAFFYLFWGAIKAGIVPVPLNTLLRSSSYAYMIDDSSAAAVVYSPEFAGEVEPAIAAATQSPRYILRTEGN